PGADPGARSAGATRVGCSRSFRTVPIRRDLGSVRRLLGGERVADLEVLGGDLGGGDAVHAGRLAEVLLAADVLESEADEAGLAAVGELLDGDVGLLLHPLLEGEED